jgi:hypothetical protein
MDVTLAAGELDFILFCLSLSREACRVPDNLNRLDSPLVRVPYSCSGHELESLAGQILVR